MNYLTDKEIKRELTDSLCELDEFLRKKNINYSIMSGTMLGCIRHGGFIPWDDDIDIALLRPEYNKLLEILKNNSNMINKDLYVSGLELGNGSLPFLKIFNKRVLVKENMVNKPQNLWIDIFPFDGIPKEYPKYYINYVMFLRKIYHYRRNDILINKKNKKQIVAKKVVEKLTSLIATNKFENYYVKVCSKFKIDESKWVEDLTWGTKSIPVELFNDIVEYKFEDIIVRGFKDYDMYLKRIYGNYMELPPEHQRINHGVKAWRVDENEE